VFVVDTNVFVCASDVDVDARTRIQRIYTRDTDFHRFRFVEVIDPLAGCSLVSYRISSIKSRHSIVFESCNRA
jgi:hypothetical protein